MDTLLHFLFWAVVETVLFGFGRAVLRLASFRAVRLEKPGPFQAFVVAIFGFFVLVLMVVVLVCAYAFFDRWALRRTDSPLVSMAFLLSD